MQKYIQVLKDFRIKRPSAALLYTSVVALCVLTVLIYTIIANVQHERLSRQALIKINQLNIHLGELSNQIANKPTATPEQLSKIKQQLDLVQQILPKLNNGDEIKQLKQIVSINDVAILKKLDLFEAHTKKLNSAKSITKNQFISANRLPFQIIGIDVWNDNPEVTILTQDKRYQLIGEEENYLGWKLMTVSFHPAFVIFQNAQHLEIKVRV